jgi:phospholipid transport system substrate-binding protein
MKISSKLRFLLTLVMALVTLTLAAAAESPAAAVVRTSTERVLAEIKARRSEFEANDQVLNDFIRDELDKVFDTPYSARLVLGVHSRSATPEQITAFGKALSNNLMKRYCTALLKTTNDTGLKMLGESALSGGKIIRVKSQIARSGGGVPVAVDYLLRDVAGQWRAFDVIIEGVSYVQTFRSQFDPLLRSKGIDAVTRDLQEGRIEADPDAGRK